MHLFLDANIYLGFFKLSGDDLEELRKLAVAVRSGDTVLYLTDQVRDEFSRNRASTISESLKVVEGAQLPKAYPRLLTNLDGYSEMRKSLELFEQQRGALLDQARGAALAGDLHADHLIRELFAIARRVPLSAEIQSAAEARHRLGNPPGKRDSLGDSMNWESLLSVVPMGAELVLVSADRDYASKLDPQLVDEFLFTEWSEVKKARVLLYDSLTAVFKAHYPAIRLAADLERSLAIDALIASPTFRATHLSIQKLSDFVDFTPSEAASLIEAAISNSQIRLIIGDDDVRAFYATLMERFGDRLPEAGVARVREALAAFDELM
jgi:hypothetical protein